MSSSTQTPSRSPSEHLPGRLAYSVPNAARALDIGERTLWAMIKRGEIRAVRFGKKRVLIPADELRRLLQA